MKGLVSVVVPVYNERATVLKIVDRVAALSFEKEILIVDDGSTDGTGELLRDQLEGRPDVRAFHFPRNLGKGAALRRGLAEARGEIVIIQDADLELEPEEIAQVIAPVRDGRAQAAFGSRFLSGFRRPLSPHYWANRLLTGLANALYGARLTDEATCYKCARRELLLSLDLRSDGFEIDAELTAKLLRRGIAVAEVPVAYHPRTDKEGKKIGWRDGVLAAATLLKHRFSSTS